MAEAHEVAGPISGPRATRRRVPRVIAGALICLLTAEGAVRLLESRLPDPPDWFSPPAARLVREMDVAQSRGLAGGLTVTGSSTAGRGLVPSVLARGTSDSLPARSVALGGGGQTTLQERWLLEEVVPRIHPKSVVWGVSSLDFNRGRRLESIGRYNRSRATRSGPLGSADRALARISAIARNRAGLRDPYVMSKVLSGSNERRTLRTRVRDDAVTFAFEEPALSPARLARMQRLEARYARDVQLRNFAVGRAEVKAFRRTLRSLRRSRTRAAVVLMPVTQQYIEAHPHGTRDFDRWVRVVTHAARDEHVPLIDATKAMPASAFRDIEHLKRARSAEFTAKVRDQLIAAGW